MEDLPVPSASREAKITTQSLLLQPSGKSNRTRDKNENTGKTLGESPYRAPWLWVTCLQRAGAYFRAMSHIPQTRILSTHGLSSQYRSSRTGDNQVIQEWVEKER